MNSERLAKDRGSSEARRAALVGEVAQAALEAEERLRALRGAQACLLSGDGWQGVIKLYRHRGVLGAPYPQISSKTEAELRLFGLIEQNEGLTEGFSSLKAENEGLFKAENQNEGLNKASKPKLRLNQAGISLIEGFSDLIRERLALKTRVLGLKGSLLARVFAQPRVLSTVKS